MIICILVPKEKKKDLKKRERELICGKESMKEMIIFSGRKKENLALIIQPLDALSF